MLFSISSFAQQVEVTVNIRGLISSKGKVFIAVFSNPEGYPGNADAAIAKSIIEIKDNKATTTMALPPGTYAWAVFHDENNNQILDKNIFGYPKEKFGFSNNPKINFGAPTFNECSLAVNTTTKTITINLN
ncbi:MAG TPA: DUF2141 domain-containing protein [Cytophagales bacterium]|nr:DUF2141 domain-containing protein [Cytophagales bacterium]